MLNKAAKWEQFSEGLSIQDSSVALGAVQERTKFYKQTEHCVHELAKVLLGLGDIECERPKRLCFKELSI